MSLLAQFRGGSHNILEALRILGDSTNEDILGIVRGLLAEWSVDFIEGELANLLSRDMQIRFSLAPGGFEEYVGRNAIYCSTWGIPGDDSQDSPWSKHKESQVVKKLSIRWHSRRPVAEPHCAKTLAVIFGRPEGEIEFSVRVEPNGDCALRVASWA